MRPAQTIRGVLLLVGLALALMAQFVLLVWRDYYRDALLMWAAAIVAFTAVFLSTWRRSSPALNALAAAARAIRRRPRRAAFLLAGAVAILAAGVLARNWPAEADYTSLFFLWLFGLALIVGAWTPRIGRCGRPLASVVSVLRRRWVRVAIVACLIGTACVLRAYDLEHIPANLGGDEGIWGVEGRAMLRNGRMANPFATRWFSFPSMSFLLWGVGLRVFGDTLAGLRMTSAILGTGAVLATMLLAQQLWSWRAAWFAGVASAFSHYAIHYSRLAYNNIGDPLIVGLVLWLLSRSLDRSRSALLQAASAGVLTGLGWYGYFGARLIGIIVTVFLLWRSIVEHAFLRRHRDRILIYVACAVMAASPLLLHYVDQPQALAERSRQVSIFGSGWLQQEQQASGKSVLSLLTAQIWKSVLGFHYTLDPTLIYHAEIPLLDAVSGVLVIIGLTWSFLTRQRRASSLLLTWLGLAVLFGWVLTENPPSSQRLLVATPAVAILTGVGFDTLLHAVDAVAYSSRIVHVTIGVLFVLSVALLNTVYYFVAYTPSRVYGNPTAEVTTDLSRYLLVQDDDCMMYFHGPPFVYWEFGTLRFMVPGVEGINVFDVEPEDREAASHEGAQRARFFFLPERREELNAVRDKLPGGTESRFYSSADGRLLFLLYEVCDASSEE